MMVCIAEAGQPSKQLELPLEGGSNAVQDSKRHDTRYPSTSFGWL